MNIVFYSPLHGQMRQSSNMMAISMGFSKLLYKRCLITQTQYSYNDLEDMVIGRTSNESQRDRFFEDIGIDSLIRNFKKSAMTKETVSNCTVPVGTDGMLELLPGSRAVNRGMFDEVMVKVLPAVVREVQGFYDYVFVDSNPGLCEQTENLINNADMVVVNLSQNIGVLDRFFMNFPECLKGKKVFYLFGSYMKDSRYNFTNLSRKYRELKKNNTGVVPLNVNFMDAISGGDVSEFFRRNIDADENDDNFSFMEAIKADIEKMSELL